MKPIALLLSISVTLVPFSALALSARTVSIEEAQGTRGSIITLEVAPGYGLNINLIPTGEIVKKAWIDDPSRITLSFDGNLCQGASSPDQQCNNEGATVIHLRQIKPIQFPNLPRSSGGGTLLTLITESSQGRKIYQFKIVPVSGQPKYTVLNVSSEDPSNTPLLRGRNVPLMVNNNFRRRGYQNNLQQPQNTARIERRRNNQLAQSPPVETPIEPVIASPTTSAINQSATLPPAPTPEISPTSSSTSIPLVPTVPSSQTLPLPDSKPRQKLVSPNPKVTETKTPPIATVSIHETPSVPTISNPQPSTISNNKPKQSSVVTSKTSPSSNKPALNTTASIPKNSLQSSNTKQPSTSIAQANALVRGLVIARQKGHINNKTKLWKQVQSVVLLLRRGVTKPEAVKKVGVSLQLVEQLIVWGSSPTSTFTSFNKIPTN